MSSPLQPDEGVVEGPPVRRTLLRAVPVVAAMALIAAGAAFLLLYQAEPRYSAEARLLLEPAPAGAGPEAGLLLDRDGIGSQVQLIRSPDVAQAVIDALRLGETGALRPAGSWLDNALAALGLSGRPALPARQAILETFLGNLSVRAVNGSRAVAIAFRSADPDQAADVANAVAAQYIALLQSARKEAPADATQWLQAEIAALGTRLREAEEKAEAFRAANRGLLGAGEAMPAALASQLTALNAERLRLEADHAEAAARSAQLREALAGGTAPELSDAPLIETLRAHQLTLQAEIGKLSATLLPEHPRLRELQAQAAELDRQLRAETARLASAAEAEVQRLEARQAEVKQQLAALEERAAASEGAILQLQALEREAAAQRDALQLYLQRYREPAPRAGLPAPVEARVIMRARPPASAYFPRTGPVTAAVFLAVLLLGLAVARLRRGRAPTPAAVAPPLPLVPDAVPVDGRLRWPEQADVRRMMPHDQPASALADQVERSLAAIAVQIGASGARRILTIMAEENDRGARPPAALALARTLARGGERVVAVDLHRPPAGTAEMAGFPGFSDLFAGDASFSQVIFRDRRSPAHIIPAGRQPLQAALAGSRLATLLDALDHTYDHAVYDIDNAALPALGAVADAVVLVTGAGPADPRTVRAYEAIKAVSPAEVMILLAEGAGTADADAA